MMHGNEMIVQLESRLPMLSVGTPRRRWPLWIVRKHSREFLRAYRQSDAAFVRAEGVGSGLEQRKLALETAMAEVSTLKSA